MLKTKWIRARFFRAPDANNNTAGGASPAGDTGKTEQPATYQADDVGFPGGERLLGATIVEPSEEGLPSEWTEANASQDEDDEDEGTNGAMSAKGKKVATEGEKAPEGDEDEDEEKEVELKAAEAAAKKTDDGDETAEEAEARKQWPESAQKRVDKLTAQRSAAERERDEARAKVAELETKVASNGNASIPVPMPSPETPLIHVTDENLLAAEAVRAREIEDWADDNRDGGEVPAELAAYLTGRKPEEFTDKPLVISAEDAKAMRRNARNMREEHIPKHAQAIQLERQADAYLTEFYPDYVKDGTPEKTMLESFARQFPGIRVLPQWKVALADTVRGALLRQAEDEGRRTKAEGKATTPKAEVIPLAPVPPGASRSASPNGKPSTERPVKKSELSAHMSEEELIASM